ncbi:hypothetical protein POG22_05080 [Geitlerinema sp. CS-897]|uniref:hypothetical protein n=1 Tax=Baaleninema simplex TaxID=2862350 RepID=UPI000379E3EE|nr:hypothetical protein [Baaleninema simplex]MDC0832383.1 hypothetical protein [Geitlerinema sp. CS-897]
MLLLDREISKKTKAGIHAKISMTFQEEKLDANSCRLVKRYLGTTTNRATIQKAFVFLAGRHSQPDRKFLDCFSYDDASKILHYIDKSARSTQKNNQQDSDRPMTLIDVKILKWNLLILSSNILTVNPNIESTEDIIDAVLKLALESLETLFGSEEVIENGSA